MVTISNVLQQIISGSPFLEEYLSKDLINLSSLARQLRPEVEAAIGKSVKDSTVMMALKRIPIANSQLHSKKIEDMLQHISDISIRSSLIDLTFKNSGNLRACLTKLMHKIESDSEVFFTLSQGIYESTIIINKDWEDLILEIFKKETCISVEKKITAINLKLPELNTKTKGIYYMIFKHFADSSINIKDVVSTSNELTILIDACDSEKAFSTVNKLRKV